MRMSTCQTLRRNFLLCSFLKFYRGRQLATLTMVSDGSCAQLTPTAGSVPLFALTSLPVLCSVDSIQVARFLKKRELYELENTSKQVEISSLKALPYIASINRSFSNNPLFRGKFDTIS